MFRPRTIQSHSSWSDPDGIKIYTISAQNQLVNQAPYLAQLLKVKKQKNVQWSSTPAFTIFHDGASMAYLILAWWGNDNELFTSVSVHTISGWIEDASKYSFCVYDLEVIWQERNYFIEYFYCTKPSIENYRAKRFRDNQ